jgi:glycosyltransferase involved in cell wall biosynthesis
MLAPAIVEERVIPLGVDLSVFHPGDRREARGRLGIPEKARLVLVTADRGRMNPWKDFETARRAMQRAGDLLPDTELLFVALGDEGGEEGLGRSVLRGVPPEDDPARVADWYRAADAYLHPSRADTFPLAVLEAMACGLPVVASDVGGIGEQVISWDGDVTSAAEGPEGPTGGLVPAGKDEPMAVALHRLFTQPEVYHALSRNGLERARARFDWRRYAEAMIDWYLQLAAHGQAESAHGLSPAARDR